MKPVCLLNGFADMSEIVRSFRSCDTHSFPSHPSRNRDPELRVQHQRYREPRSAILLLERYASHVSIELTIFLQDWFQILCICLGMMHMSCCQRMTSGKNGG